MAVSARTAANRQKRVVLAYDGLEELQRRMADGLLEIGERILAEASAKAPRDQAAAAERGVPMMADTGAVQVWANGKRVAGTWETKPRGGKVPKVGAVMFVGFGSRVAHLIEFGTIKMPAQPFFTPTLMDNINDAGPAIQASIQKRSTR